MWQIIVRFITFKPCVANCTMQFLKISRRKTARGQPINLIFLLSKNNVGIVIVPLRNRIKKKNKGVTFFSSSTQNMVRTIKAAHQKIPCEKKFRLRLNFARFLNIFIGWVKVWQTIMRNSCTYRLLFRLKRSHQKCHPVSRIRERGKLYICIYFFMNSNIIILTILRSENEFCKKEN